MKGGSCGGKAVRGVSEHVKMPSKGSNKGPSKPSKKVSGGGPSKKSQAY